MATTLGADERLALIYENLAETLNPEIIDKIVREGGSPKVYWGTLGHGCRPHQTKLAG